MKFVTDVGLLYKRYTLQMLRNPVWLFVGFSTPILYLVLFMPLLTVFSEALARGWQMARDALVEPDALAAIRLTLIVAGIAVPLNMIFGLAASWCIAKFDFKVTALTVNFDVASGTARVFGVAADQETKEKVILAAGNVAGVAAVQDMMTVDRSAPEAQYYSVVSGDTLSKIAKQFYGKSSQWNAIFEANRDQLDDPDKIQPGQVLRIPAIND